MNMNNYLNDLFSDSAKNKLQQQIGKVYNYSIKYLSGVASNKNTGRCIVVDRYYDDFCDCDMIVIEDINTKEQLIINQFELILMEVE